MNLRDWLQFGLLIGILLLTAKPLGIYLANVFAGERTILFPVLRPIERLLYRILHVDPNEEQDWKHYSLHLLTFAAMSCLFTYVLLRLQTHLPLNPQALGRLSPDLSFNATLGFHTNTSWQSYSGERSMSYFSQTVPLCFQFFISPAIGLCASTTVIRGLSRKESNLIGVFWVDLIRGLLYVLLPLAILFGVFFLSQGVIQNFNSYTEVTTLEGAKQVIAQGPAASFTVMKVLGSNGGGFFNSNGAHPFDNPTPLTDFFQLFLILLLPSAIIYQLGHSAGCVKHAWTVWAAVALMFAGGTLVCGHFETSGNPAYTAVGCASSANWEGKEARFGIFNSSLYAVATTDSSCGSVNSAHDSFTPMGGFVLLLNLVMGEVIYGGVGSGLYGLVVFILITIFITGLMVGRTPEYLGKSIQSKEIKYVMLALVATTFLSLAPLAWACLDPRAWSGLGNPKMHGFSEMLYAYTSASMNNGSSFSGLNTNSYFWNLSLAFVFFFGRYFTMIPMIALAGSMAQKRVHPGNESAFPAYGLTFGGLLITVIILVGALTHFPTLALGPISEHFEMMKGHWF